MEVFQVCMVLVMKQTLNFSSTLFYVWASVGQCFPNITKKNEQLQRNRNHFDHLNSQSDFYNIGPLYLEERSVVC